MTVESYAQAPAYTIAGVGPYPIPHPYLAGTIVAYVLIEDVPTQLDGADFSVDPVMAVDQGNLLLTDAAATTHDGRTLWIERATPLEQGWMARDDGREAGMEAQLDQGTMSAQEDRAQIGAALRARKPMAAFDPVANCVPVVRPDGNGYTNGPTLTEIYNAEQNAQDALAARKAAEAAALTADVHKADFTALDAATDIITGQVVRVRDGENGKPEDGLTVPAATYTADGSLVRDLAGSGLQWVSFRREFASVAEMRADPRGYSAVTSGQIFVVPSKEFRYEVRPLGTAFGPSGYHLTTAGGVLLRVLPNNGGYNVKAFGAVGDWNGTQSVAGTGTDDTAAIQIAVNTALADGELPRFPPGRYRTTAPILIDRSALGDDPINGEMAGAGLVGSGASSCQIVADHDGKCISFTGGSGAGWHTFFSLDGIGLLKGDYAKTAGSVGLSITEAAYFTIGRFDIYGFERGIDGVDCLSGAIADGSVRGNSHGWRFQKGTRSHPNSITFRDVRTINNTITGGSVYKPGLFRYIGGSIESNGYTGMLADPTSWGVYVENAGVEGSVGIDLDGVYIENNNGKADVWILQDAAGVAGAAVHKITGCSFLRFSDTRYVTQNVFFNCINDSKLYVAGNGFKDFAPYPSSGARPFITAGNAQVIDGGGNVMLDASGGNTGISRAVFAPQGVNHQLPFASLPDVVKNRNGIQYCADGTGSSLPSLAVSDGVRWWQLPLGQFSGRVASAGTALRLPRGWTCSKTGTGVYVITHNLGLAANTYSVVASPSGTPGTGYCSGMSLSGNTFEVYFSNTAGASADMDFNFNMQII